MRTHAKSTKTERPGKLTFSSRCVLLCSVYCSSSPCCQCLSGLWWLLLALSTDCQNCVIAWPSWIAEPHSIIQTSNELSNFSHQWVRINPQELPKIKPSTLPLSRFPSGIPHSRLTKGTNFFQQSPTSNRTNSRALRRISHPAECAPDMEICPRPTLGHHNAQGTWEPRRITAAGLSRATMGVRTNQEIWAGYWLCHSSRVRGWREWWFQAG